MLNKTNAYAVVAATYVVLVLAMWLPFGPYNGMSYETNLALHSETSSVLLGFFFTDPLRIHTNFFYHLGYLLSKALGIKGSWFAYQLVYAGLWLGRGWLCYLIVRRLVPESPAFAFLVGALAILHASDHTLNWVGQMNQFGFIFWMLVSFLMLLKALDAHRRTTAVVWAVLSAFFSYMSLWSYEAQLPVMLLTPLLFAFWRDQDRRLTVAILAIALVPALIYLVLNGVRYLAGVGGGYQVSHLRSDLSVRQLFLDLLFNIKYALAFWSWSELLPARYAQQSYVLAPLIGSAAFALGGIAMLSIHRDRPIFPQPRSQLLLAVGASLLLAASFPAYVILDSARWLWRTQFLAGPFAALLMATLAGLVAVLVKQLASSNSSWRPRFDRAALIVSGTAVAFYGVAASERTASFHFMIWERARTTIAQVVAEVPRVAPNSIIVLLDVPRKDADGSNVDPFGYNGWFDVAMKLSYPDANVAGYYFWRDGAAPATEFYDQRKGADVPRMIILRQVAGSIRLERTFPPELRIPADAAATYDPSPLILSGPPSKEARNRYLRFVAPWVSQPKLLRQPGAD